MPPVVQAHHGTSPPPAPARRTACQALRGELRSHPVGHFDAYFGDAFDAFVAEQVEFLGRRLG